MPSIYISIASCKDAYLVQTVKSAIANADNPQDLYFGIFNTFIDDKYKIDDPIIIDNPNVFYLECNSPIPLGTGISRLNASMLFTKEHDYLLQIDAHTIFAKGWDSYHIRKYKELLKVCNKPIITYSSVDWREDSDGRMFILHNDDKVYYIDPYDLDTKNIDEGIVFNNGSLKINLRGDQGHEVFYVEPVGIEWPKNKDYSEHSLINASFMFSDFEMNRAIMHDPYQPWDGDQLNFSLRAYCLGYRCFTVKDVFVFTLNKSEIPNSDIKIKDIDDYDTNEKMSEKQYKDFLDLQYKNKRKYQQQIFIGTEFGYWGSQSYTKRKAFLDMVGIDWDKLNWKSL